MLPKSSRLTKEKDFRDVYKKGGSLSSPSLAVRFKKYPLSQGLVRKTRFGFVVSNKIHKSSVKRNRIKRRLRAIVGANLNNISSDADCFIIARPLIKQKKYQEIKIELEQLLKRAGIIKIR